MVWSEGEELEGFRSGLEGAGDLGATRMASRGCTSKTSSLSFTFRCR